MVSFFDIGPSRVANEKTVKVVKEEEEEEEEKRVSGVRRKRGQVQTNQTRMKGQ